ncbi:Amino acid permease/ SLC12A domain-containing protein [Mycena venus]|uniref:Amino acid permease/ SLC12A domain-containing protein n=1 Tax=Mycena venus TaxID=2733690 RepID=A0A8H6XL75_9AGAR|nr:Amino acid permease/ SLC12A domain-containing protein [Mycena venus]
METRNPGRSEGSEPDKASEVKEVRLYVDTFKIDVKTGLYDGLQRNMKQRHIQMIALAGTLGTGLFLGSGKAIAHAGPAGALLAYMHVGTICYCMLMSLGEMMCFMPISGGYIHFAERFIDPAMGFAVGWLQWYSGVVGLPMEIIGTALIIGFWDTEPGGTGMSNAHFGGYLTLLLCLCILVNCLGVRWFGETEFVFHPGAFAPYVVPGNRGKFLGWFQTLLQAAISYNGMENLAMTAAEVENPRHSLAKAVRRVFYRILIFYVLGVFIVGMLVPSDDPNLLQSTGTAATSPFVLAMTRGGVKVLPSVINAGVLSSGFSASNSGLYASSRQIYGLALRGQAPKIFAKTTKEGLPMVALLFSSIWILLSYMALSEGAVTALNWLTNLTSTMGFCTWGIISLTYIRFYHGLKAQGIDRSKFVYWSRFQPYLAYWAFLWSLLIILFNGWTVFIKGEWNVSDFIVAYVNLPIFAMLYGAYKIVRKSKVVPASRMDFHSNVPPSEMVDFVEPQSNTVWGNIWAWLF